MSSPKTHCPKCGEDFLQSTADSNQGTCLKCRPARPRSLPDPEPIELSLRLGLACLFGFIFAGMGYGAGDLMWSGIGVILSLISFPIGFLYGFFCREINALIRGIIRTLFQID